MFLPFANHNSSISGMARTLSAPPPKTHRAVGFGGVAYIYIYTHIYLNIDHTTVDGGNPRAVDMENVIFSKMGLIDNRWLAGFQPSTVGGQV